jgi:(p)ppGpp synthase/HD superfamily hydrolase
MLTITDLTRAYHFAAVKHVNQRRKGAASEPYINHLTEVAALVAKACDSDIELIVAAVLHDTVEDTETTFDELAAAFSPRVAALVAEVTDDKSLPKLERKRLQIEHAPQTSPAAKLIKLADKIANLRSLLKSPPTNWPAERVSAYFDWAARVVAGCRGTNAWLEAEFDKVFAEFSAR